MDENFFVPYQFLSLSDVVEEGPWLKMKSEYL